MKIGQRLMTHHGPATVTAFELIDLSMDTLQHVQTDPGEGRIICELDPGHSWGFQNQPYAVYRHDIERGEVQLIEGQSHD